MLRFYMQAVGLALVGLLAGLLAPLPIIVVFSAMGTVALIWIAVLKSRGLGSGSVEMGMLIACIFFGPLALGLMARLIFFKEF